MVSIILVALWNVNIEWRWKNLNLFKISKLTEPCGSDLLLLKKQRSLLIPRKSNLRSNGNYLYLQIVCNFARNVNKTCPWDIHLIKKKNDEKKNKKARKEKWEKIGKFSHNTRLTLVSSVFRDTSECAAHIA